MRIAGIPCPRHHDSMAWEPPYEDDLTRATMDVLFEINTKLADIREHVSVIRDLLQEDDDGEEAEEG
jgi:hypothetical protein